MIDSLKGHGKTAAKMFHWCCNTESKRLIYNFNYSFPAVCLNKLICSCKNCAKVVICCNRVTNLFTSPSIEKSPSSDQVWKRLRKRRPFTSRGAITLQHQYCVSHIILQTFDKPSYTQNVMSLCMCLKMNLHAYCFVKWNYFTLFLSWCYRQTETVDSVCIRLALQSNAPKNEKWHFIQ